MMKALSLEQYNQILLFIQTYHSFYRRTGENLKMERSKFPLMPQYGMGIKYIDSCYDTRFGNVWAVGFRPHGYNFTTNYWVNNGGVPHNWKYDNLFDLIMDWLKGEYEPGDAFKMKEDV